MPTLLPSSYRKMSRACQPQHMLPLITLSPRTMPKGGFQLQVCKLTKWKKKPSQDKYTPFYWYGEISVCIAYCEITRTTSLQCRTASIPLPFAVPGAQQWDWWQAWDKSATLRSLQNTYLEGSNQVPPVYLYEKLLQRCQGTGFEDHASIWDQRGKLSSPYSCFGEHQRCFYHPYKSMIISISVFSVYQFGLTFLKLLWNCSSLRSSAKFAVVMQECQRRKSRWEIMASPGPTRVTLFNFHFMISWIVQNTKISSPCFAGFFFFP